MSQQRNPNNLREVDRDIVAAIVISSDDQFLFGQKDPSKGGVYPDAWHIPGGGIEEGEDMETAMRRELVEEVPGIPLEHATIRKLDVGGGGETERDLKGERVWVIMHFNHFEVRIPETAEAIMKKIQAGDDLAIVKFIPRAQINTLQQIPGGKEIFAKMGYMTS